MRYVIAYDIVNDRRRTHAAHIALAYGARVQDSVYEAELEDAALATLLARLSAVLQAEEDSLHVYALCKACSVRARRLGSHPEDPLRARAIVIA